MVYEAIVLDVARSGLNEEVKIVVDACRDLEEAIHDTETSLQRTLRRPSINALNIQGAHAQIGRELNEPTQVTVP